MDALIQQARLTAFWQRMFRTRAEDSLPHVVTHQRIYIVPSKRGCAFLFTLLIMLIASVNYALSLGYALSFLLTGLFAASLLHTYRNVAGLSVTAIDAQDVFAGETGEIKVTLENTHARLRHGLKLSVRDAEAQLVHADADSSVSASILIKELTRGIYKPGRLTLHSDWPLGLWSCWSYLHVDKNMFVYPAPEIDPPPLPLLSGSEANQQQHYSQSGDVSGLREYQPGDSIGSIAWKSTARGTGLRSRTFESESLSSKTELCLERSGIAGREAQLSRLSAWVLMAESQHTDYAVKLHKVSIPQGHGAQHQLDVMRALSSHGTQGLQDPGDQSGMSPQ